MIVDKSKIRHLLDLSISEKRTFLNSFDTILSDCDGVVWNFTGPIPDVDQALQLLKHQGKQVAFISNNGMRTMAEYKHKFHQLGLDVQQRDIVHPALTTVRYLKSVKMQDAVYCIGTEIFKDYLRDAGFNVLDGPHEPIPDKRETNGVRVFQEFFTETTSPKVGAVVMDIDVNISLAHLMKAKCYLQRNPECLLIAGPPTTSGRKALVLGKPGQALADFILDQFNVTRPERTLFVGDMLPQDMGFGTRCGFQKLLMLSGGTTSR
ncbi:hypothetical protein quinque_004892 [Culex quinquefasciatus]